MLDSRQSRHDGQRPSLSVDTTHLPATSGSQAVFDLNDEMRPVPSIRTRKVDREGLVRVDELKKRGGACDDCRRLKVRVWRSLTCQSSLDTVNDLLV